MSEYATIEHYINHVMDEITKRDIELVSERLRALGWEEVVRCRDCIYYKQDPDPIDPGWPMMCERTGADMVEPYGFCAWGTRKEGGE